jgi:hypothetical protein
VARPVTDAGLAPRTWVPVERHTLTVTGQQKFALGDVNALGIPKTGAVAHFQAQTVVNGLVVRIRRNGRGHPYTGRVPCLVETGAGRATKMAFDYTPRPAGPSRPTAATTGPKPSSTASTGSPSPGKALTSHGR